MNNPNSVHLECEIFSHLMKITRGGRERESCYSEHFMSSLFISEGLRCEAELPRQAESVLVKNDK